MVSIDPTMPANSERTPYKVRPVATKRLSEKEELIQTVLTQVAEQFSRAFKINELKAEVASHLAVLEKRVERECRVRAPPRRRPVTPARVSRASPGDRGGGGGASAPFPCETPKASKALNGESAANLKRDVASAGDSRT